MLWIYYLGQVWPSWTLLSEPSRCYYLGQVCVGPIFIVVLSGCLHTQLSFCVCWAQLSANILKIAFFKKCVRKCFWSNFPVRKCFFFKFPCFDLLNLFLGLLKNYIIGFLQCLCFCCSRRRKNAKENDNWNFRFGFLSKNGRFVTGNCFSEIGLLKHLFYSVFGCALFGPSCQKRAYWTKKETQNNLIDNWKAHFLVFWGFLLFLFLCFFGGFKCQVRWPEGPPHLALNPPYLFWLVFCVFLLEGLRVRWGGPKGHLTKPTFFFVFFVFFCVCFFFCCLKKSPPFPCKGAFLFIFQYLPCFSLVFSSPFPLFLCLSLIFSLFLLVFFLAFFVALLLSVCFFALFICFCFMQRTTSKYQYRKFLCLVFSVSLCLSLAFSLPLFISSISLSLSCCFLSSLFSFLLFFCCLVFVSLFLCLVSLLLFHAQNNIIQIRQFFS